MSDGVIGSLRHRVSIERPLRTETDGGAAVISWTSLASVFARIEPVGGGEFDVADGQVGRVTHKVLMRYRSDVLPQMRIVAGTRELEISAALDLDGRGRWLQCHCKEKLP